MPRCSLTAVLALVIAGCSSSSVRPVECGEGGTFHSDEVGRYCAYIVVRGGFECPFELVHNVPIGAGRVCTDWSEARAESLPPDVCRDFADRTCGVESMACLEPAPTATSACTLGLLPVGEPTGPWELPILHAVTSEPIEDGDTVVARTNPEGELVLPITFDPIWDPELSFRCYRVVARVEHADGTTLDVDVTQYLSSDEWHVAWVPLAGLGPVSIELRTNWNDGEVLVWRRDVVIEC
jgi:hypothetical protein